MKEPFCFTYKFDKEKLSRLRNHENDDVATEEESLFASLRYECNRQVNSIQNRDTKNRRLSGVTIHEGNTRECVRISQ